MLVNRSTLVALVAVVMGTGLTACNESTAPVQKAPATRPSADVVAPNTVTPILNNGLIAQNDPDNSCSEGCGGWFSWGTGADGLPCQNNFARSFWISGTDPNGAILNPQYLVGGQYCNHFNQPLSIQLQPGHNDFTVLFATAYPFGPGPWVPVTVDVNLVTPDGKTNVAFHVGEENTGVFGGPLTDTHTVGGTSVTMTFNGFSQPGIYGIPGTAVDRVAGCCSVQDFHFDGQVHVSFDVTVPSNTAAGSNVAVTPTDATTGAPAPLSLTFSNVTTAGTTTVTSSTNGPPPPDGYALFGGQHELFDITTTATFSGPVTLCINYTGTGTPKLEHFINNAWVDITTGYPSPGVVCGTTNSFSPFALFQALPPTITPAVSGTLGANGWYTSDVNVSFAVTPTFAATTGCGATSVTANTAGQTFTCSATTDGGNASKSVTVKRDAAPPAIAFAGATSYTVDQTVSVTCTVTPGVSGVVSQMCPGSSGAAYTFALGTTTLNATATSGAGVTANASTSFTVSVTVSSLSALVQRWTDNAGVANSLVVKLQHGDISAFVAEVNAQSGQHIPSSANAALLVSLAGAL